MVVLMSGMNSVSHGSQDLYPTFLKDQVGFGDTMTTVTTVVGQIGALIGSTTLGYFSSFTGRRLTIMVACLFGGAIVPAYILIRTDSLIASVFFEQFFVGGSWVRSDGRKDSPSDRANRCSVTRRSETL
jgi:SHS family lactate transporter-like MFS transporter